MTATTNKSADLSSAKITGLLYLIIAICGGFSIAYVPSVITVPGNAIETAKLILENQGLLKLGILADIAVFLMEIIITSILYQMFKPISKTTSVIAAFSRIAMTVVMGMNIINLIIPLHLLGSADYLATFDPEQLKTLTFLFLEIHANLIFVWQLFFGIHMLALGYLIHKSANVPTLLGTLMIVGAWGYLFDAIKNITGFDNDFISFIVAGLLIIVVLGELGFTFWLLIKGGKAARI